MTSAFPSDLKPSTVTGKAGGGLVDTGNSSFLTDFDKTGPGTIDTDEVDPVAEAEVYIAYGRDAQAEEILKEAMSRDKSRHEIPLKLLEIYHARKSATGVRDGRQGTARAAAGESSPTWLKAVAMGAQIDPTNPLYGGAAGIAGAAPVFAAAAPAPKPELDFDLDPASSASSAPQAASASFDLDLGGAKEPAARPARFQRCAARSTSTSRRRRRRPRWTCLCPRKPPKDEKPAFDFDLSGLDFPSSSAPGSRSATPDLNLVRGTVGRRAVRLAQPHRSRPRRCRRRRRGDAVTTKLELAKAYLEIGDKDGAREILQEVAKEGSAAQKSEAQKLIASL